MKCPQCLKKLKWGGDSDYEDQGLPGDGVITNSACMNAECSVEAVMIFSLKNKPYV
tara:strand:+ start:3457 stop:3624 length:168 start_codon:yes stop_codon:yes gene_type:complete